MLPHFALPFVIRYLLVAIRSALLPLFKGNDLRRVLTEAQRHGGRGGTLAPLQEDDYLSDLRSEKFLFKNFISEITLEPKALRKNKELVFEICMWNSALRYPIKIVIIPSVSAVSPVPW